MKTLVQILGMAPNRIDGESSVVDAWVADGLACVINAVPAELREGLLLIRTDGPDFDALDNLLSQTSRSVRTRTLLMGYDTDLVRGSRRIGPLLGRLVDFELAGAISSKALDDWSTHGRFVGPKILTQASDASCVLGLQGTNYCEWAAISHVSLSDFLAKYERVVNGFFADADATFITGSESWQERGKWGPRPVLCLLPGVELDAFALAERPALRGIDVIVTSSLEAPPAAAAYLGTAETLASLATLSDVPPELHGRIIPVGTIGPVGAVAGVLVDGSVGIDAADVDAIARAASPFVRALHASAPRRGGVS